ncbi:hypothetical protein F4604DRAFT_1919953 [Suillus subluteus]|nr:hypothetical protein F4604DRAFT_1919953 [Suillus subluteus]
MSDSKQNLLAQTVNQHPIYKKALFCFATTATNYKLCVPSMKLQKSIEMLDLKPRRRAMHIAKFKNKQSPTCDGNVDTQDLLQRLDDLWSDLGYRGGILQHEFLESYGMSIVMEVNQEGWDSVKPQCEAKLAEVKVLLQQAFDLYTAACDVIGPLTDRLRDGIASTVDTVYLHVHASEELLSLMALRVNTYFDSL